MKQLELQLLQQHLLNHYKVQNFNLELKIRIKTFARMTHEPKKCSISKENLH